MVICINIIENNMHDDELKKFQQFQLIQNRFFDYSLTLVTMQFEWILCWNGKNNKGSIANGLRFYST